MRKLLVSATFMLAAGFATTPDLVAQQTLLGVKAGFLSANVDEDGADARNAAAFGGFLRFGLGPIASFQPEALYVQKGFAGEAEGVDSTFELDYLQVPLLLQVHFPFETGVSPRVFAGPTVALELGCNISGSDGEISASFDCDQFEEFGLGLESKSVEFGLLLGGGVDVPAGMLTLTLDGRYGVGLSDIMEFEGVSGLKNRSWEVFLGAGFPLVP